jgi:coenzyme F420-dependent glucose-6-phosphate dehydrogenase
MTEFGYALSSEEHAPNDLVTYAKQAEEVGFSFALISDHFHPWIDRQGHSPFVWTVLGAIANATKKLRVGTGVTCPIIRTHPAVIAQAAATTSAMMPGRFFLGVGTGENLNEHITGARWPAADERLDMLEEAVGVMRDLWKGDDVTHRGRHYRVEQARLYTVPDEPTPVYMAASGEQATDVAGRIADGFISTAPKKDLVQRFESKGGSGKPRIGQVAVCGAQNEQDARRTAFEWWPTAAVEGELSQELPLPRHFEQAVKGVTEDDVANVIVCGPDADRHVAAIREYVDAGFDHVYVHQIGPDQEGFFRFYAEHVLPNLDARAAA